MRKKVTLIAIVLIIILVCVGLYLYKSHENQQAKLNVPKPGARVVPFATAKPATWHEVVHAIGTVQSRKGVILKAEVSGRITDVFAKAGTQVKKGQPIFQVYPNTLRAELNAAKAQLELARFNVERMKRLEQENAISLQSYEQALKNYRYAKANVDKIASQLALTTVRAPFDGMVGLRQVEKGDYVEPGDTLASFETRQNLRVAFSVPGTFAKKVKNGAEVILSQHDQQQIKTKVTAINATIDPSTRQLMAWADVTNPYLYPGEYVDVMLNLGKPYHVITIPQTALIQSTYGSYVFTVTNGVAKKVNVKTGDRRDELIGILDGLKGSETVIAGGQINLRDGSKVTDKTPLIPSTEGKNA